MNLIDKAIAPVFPGWALRRAAARVRLRAAEDFFAADDARRLMLSSYSAAEKTRRTNDWRAPFGSADLAILTDIDLMQARAREMRRNSDVIASVVSAFGRNVIGRGIVPVPVAKDANGQELRELNDTAEEMFWRWATKRQFCDVEKRQTFWQKQALLIEEWATVGEAFIVWSYQPNDTTVGLRLQSFEAEQLDGRKNHNPDTGNQIRKGVEIDAYGAAVAYWFFVKPTNDYQETYTRNNWTSIRIPAERVFHFFRQERARQTRGVSPLASVILKARDLHRFDEATLWAALMEACVGMIIRRETPTESGGTPSFAPASGDTGLTASGMRKVDFVPGMVAELAQGESAEAFDPRRPGNNYDPFSRAQLRRIAAGANISYEQVARDFSQGTYSSQRQGMLEDWRTWRPLQDSVIDTFILPVYELWYRFAVMEGRIPAPADYWTDPDRYAEAEYLPDGHEWIDPEKEMNANEKALQLRLITRRDIISARGGRVRRVFEQLADEKRMAERVGLTLPEDAEPAQKQLPPAAEPKPDPPTPPAE